MTNAPALIEVRMNVPSIPNALLLAALATIPLACIEMQRLPNEHHCAQQSGDEWCAERHPDLSRPFCMRGTCEAEGSPDPRPSDGCVTTRPPDDACYSPCGGSSSLLEDATCLQSSTTDPTPTPDPSTADPGLPACGDGILDADETCDDADRNGTAGHCALDCQGPTPYCGDGLRQADEACDDGNTSEGDGCNPDCRASGSVVWERALVLDGFIRGVAIDPGDIAYLAGGLTGQPGRGWAARLDHERSAIAWAQTTEPAPTAVQSDVFFAVQALGEGLITFAGRRSDQAYTLLLDEHGELLEEGVDPNATYVGDFAVLDDGYLAKRDDEATHYNFGLSPQWTASVGSGLAYRPGDLVALAAVGPGAGFRRFTLEGIAFEPVVFWVPPSHTAQSELVAWTSTGDVVVAGQVSAASAQDALVLRSTAGGDLRWLYGIETLQAQVRRADCLAVDGLDAVIVGGSSTLLAQTRPLLMKLSAEGELLWRRDLEFVSAAGRVYGCTTNAAREVIAVGESDGHMWLAKVTP